MKSSLKIIACAAAIMATSVIAFPSVSSAAVKSASATTVVTANAKPETRAAKKQKREQKKQDRKQKMQAHKQAHQAKKTSAVNSK